MKGVDRTGAWVGESAWIDQKHQYPFATQVTHMDRVSTRGSLYRMSLFPRLERVATNIPANILLLEEPPPMGLGDSNGSANCSKWQTPYGSFGSCLTM